MAVTGARITVDVAHAQSRSPAAGVTVSVSPSVFLSADMAGSPVTSVVSNGLGQVVVFGVPGTYSFDAGAGVVPIPDQVVGVTLSGGATVEVVAASVEVGSVSTLPAGSPATVVNSGTDSAAVLDFGIPQGTDGEAGAPGPPGSGSVSSVDGVSPVSGDVPLGAAKKANNLSDLTNAATARTNLGLGTAATHPAGDFLASASNLSDVANTTTARTNLGLGNSATKNTGTTTGTVAAGDDSRITGAAQKTSNLSDLASAATARTNLGLGSLATVTPTGTPDGTKFLRDDNTWQTPTGSSLTSSSGNLSGSTNTGSLGTFGDIMFTASLATGTWLVTFTANLLSSSGSTTGTLQLTTGSATATFAGPTGTAVTTNAAAPVPATISVIATVTGAGTLKLRGTTSGAAAQVQQLTAAGSLPATGYVAVKIA